MTFDVAERGKGAVLVTGASTGIGRAITERLAAEGCFVFAGARSRSHLEALEELRNVQALALDVTNKDDIDTARVAVERSGRSLYGIINNAGVATLGPVIGGDEREFETVMAVNLFGPYRITRAFAPLVIPARGRIVTIGSICGVLADRLLSAYSMSKHALEAFTDSLAEELLPLGVQVSIVEPGTFKSELATSAMRRGRMSTGLPDLTACIDPNAVVDAVLSALFADHPKRRYLVVATEHEAIRTLEKQIEQLVQLNAGHKYSRDRCQVIEMLDKALAAVSRSERIEGALWGMRAADERPADDGVRS